MKSVRGLRKSGRHYGVWGWGGRLLRSGMWRGERERTEIHGIIRFVRAGLRSWRRRRVRGERGREGRVKEPGGGRGGVWWG